MTARVSCSTLERLRAVSNIICRGRRNDQTVTHKLRLSSELGRGNTQFWLGVYQETLKALVDVVKQISFSVPKN